MSLTPEKWHEAQRLHEAPLLALVIGLVAVALGAAASHEFGRRTRAADLVAAIRAASAQGPLEQLQPDRQLELKTRLREARTNDFVRAGTTDDEIRSLERGFDRLRVTLRQRGLADLAVARDTTQPEGIRELRRLSGCTIAGDLIQPCKFFAAVDRQTNSILLDALVERGEIRAEAADQRRLAIESVFYELVNRVRLRCNGLTPAGTYPLFEDRVFAGLRRKLRLVSDLFLGIVDQHFGSGLDAFERAFALFANGQLRQELPSLVICCQPSSGYFFLFGELALMAIDYDLDRYRWQALASVMVRTQRIYSRVYAPADKAGATYLTYNSSNYRLHGQPFTPAEVDGLKLEFEGKDLALEAARHAAAEMPGLLTA